ncbi:MAG: coproporphyrinogen dehydrogenase HemZ [Gudongella sp.]|nr:coproporphyrinogen dehydrogenase HemZ [Gudongella sp.]
MISIIDYDRILSEHEIYELTHAFYNSEEIVISDKKSPNNSRLVLELFKKEFSYKGILVNDLNNSISKEIELDILNIYRDKTSTSRIIGKQILCQLYEIESGITLPWGILTGIRPTKIVHKLIDLSINTDEIFRILTSGYLISDEKAELLIRIAKRQREVVVNIKKNSYSLYINIPFCPSRCSYCTFPSLPAIEYSSEIDKYVDIILKELELSRQKMTNWKINSVYIGGGTPTSLSLSSMERLIYEIKTKYPGINEFSVEAGRPDTLNYEYLELFKKYDIDRISINPQTMNDETLKRIKRSHSVQDTINCFKQAKEIGIKIINMDIILGLPGENIYHLNNTINEIKKLNPENFTVHVLSIKKGSEYMNNNYKYLLENYDSLNEMIKTSKMAAEDMNLKPYYIYRQKNILGNFENVGYSSKDNICNYNISIMEEKETIIGIGMGAVSKIYDKKLDILFRLPNYKNLKDYINNLDSQVTKRNSKLYEIEKSWIKT